MVHKEKLPWEMIEEILSRVPPKSFVYFRTVSKKWNALFDDKMFLNNHKSTFRFVLTTKSKIYSVSIDPKIVVRELTLDIPGLESQTPKKLVNSNEFLLCHMDKGAAVWNPWLKQTRMIMPEVSQLRSQIDGIGRVEEKVDKRLGFNNWKGILNHNESNWKIHDFATGAWKDKIEPESSGTTALGRKVILSHTTSGVSLNGNLYWISYYDKTDPLYHLVKFDFSSEQFILFRVLPCPKNHPCDVLVLRVFKENRFSLLKQCHVTKKIEIWVTKDKINNDVVWMTFMEISIPNLPDLVQTGSDSRPSYFIEDKRLVVCCCDETGRAWIYVMGENKLINKTKIEYVVDLWPSHCTYFPNLVPVPQRQREEAELQV